MHIKQRVQGHCLLGTQLSVCDALAVFDEQPVADDKEVVSKEPGALQHISIDNAYELIAKPALLLQRPVPVRFTERRTSAKFEGTD
jgi:hypothetical protein